ncbi:fimbrial protein [Pseudomonas chlororaphis]|uniref:Fimbrial-type adhesion domain-containing protein n=1 Tax=Pseudomonas chlororaphis TaxID=587753 RepID=A0A0D5XXN3_9PSED|nr:fimbrial protein [Pseudomonas chlororaphis]AKA23492.1 hypothetical protein PCL1606_20390 [Pseudomonas chlororaphis]
MKPQPARPAKQPTLKRVAWIAGLLALLGSAGAMANTCEFSAGNPLGNQPVTATMPLVGGNLTVGRDMPLGSEIYRQTFMPSTATGLHCINLTGRILERNYFSSTPLPRSDWSGSPYGGKVYESGVAGIGVAIWFRGDTLPYNWTMTNCDSMMPNCNLTSGAGNMALVVSLIKIGEVAPGVVNGANFPSVIRDLQTSNVLTTLRLSFSGTLNIVSRTCSTPDVTVPMGTHQLSEFSGVNSATPWKDFSIALNNCPAFHGFYSGTGPRWNQSGAVDNLDSRTSNVLRLRLDPVRTAINPGQGILSLDPSAPGGAAAASGIGLQVADSHGGALPLATLRPSGITPRATEGVSYSIPLKARYIQTAGRITAGPANASAVFTINYQ